MIITDSLGAPRKDKDIIYFKDTWPSMLFEYMYGKDAYYNYIYTQKALDTKELCRLLNMNLDLYDSEFVFLQVGIVDCARRVLSQKALRVINILPGIRRTVNHIAHKYHYSLSKLYKVTYTKPNSFYSNISFFLDKFRNSKKIFVIPIIPAGNVQLQKSYEIQEQIDLYNSILKEACENALNAYYIEDLINRFYPIMDDNYTSDGYHVSKVGHLNIYGTIIQAL